MLNLVGRQVEVRKVNGCILSGVFCSSSVPGATPDDVQPSPSSGPYTPDGFTLRYVTHVGGPKPSAEFGPRDRVKIAWSDVETILAPKAGGPIGWAATPESIATLASAPATNKKIETDTKISKSADSSQSKKAPHALRMVPQEWLGEPASNADLKGDHGGFDQFKVNESQFGVKSTYKEELYTTELDKSQFTAEQTARAERMAREIENASSSNSHLLEERGKKVEGDGWDDDDEEAKYGAVLGSGGYEKYKPPMKRAQEQQQQQPQQGRPERSLRRRQRPFRADPVRRSC